MGLLKAQMMAQRKGHLMVTETGQMMVTPTVRQRECLKECQMEDWMGTQMAEVRVHRLEIQKEVWWEYQVTLLDLKWAA